MEDKNLFGKLVYITPHLEHWIKEVNPTFNIPMANRIARVIKVFDWDSPEGKLLLAARERTGKWNNLDPKDFKFVLRIFYPDLILKNKTGVTAEEVVPRYYPKTQLEMFHEVPDWMLSDIRSEEKIKEFSLVTKSTITSNVRQRTKVSKNDAGSLDKKVITLKIPRKNVSK